MHRPIVWQRVIVQDAVGENLIIRACDTCMQEAQSPRMKTRGANLRLLVTGGLFASLFLALVLAVAPQSHERAHQDAATDHHECAVTLIVTGKYQQSEAPVLVSLPQPAVRWGTIPSFYTVWVAAPFLGACIFEHAPPALS